MFPKPHQLPVLQPERPNKLPSVSLWASAPVKGCCKEPTVSQIAGKTDSPRKGARTWDYMVKRKDSKRTKSLVVDFTVTFIYCIWYVHCPECRRGFIVLHHWRNSEKSCNLLRTSDRCSCYLSLSTADVTKQPVLAWAEDRGSVEAAWARSCPCCLSLGRWYRAGYSRTCQHCPSHNTDPGLRDCGRVRTKVRRARSIHDNLKVAIITFTWKLPENELHVLVRICKCM